jgi:hypothetical protein
MMSTNKIDNSNIRQSAYILFYSLIAIFSITLLFVFMDNKVYENLDGDVFYYQAVADSLRQTGQFRNMVINPSAPIITPQNAAAIIQYFISGGPFSPEQRLKIFVMINFLSLVCSVYPLLKIAWRFGISHMPSRLALVAAYLCGWHVVHFYLLPLNDGIFATCSLWLMYFILLLNEKDLTIRDLFSSKKCLFFTVIILSAALIHFRLNAIMIPMAGLFSAILIKRYRMILPMLLLCATMFLSLVTPYLFIDTSGIGFLAEKVGKQASMHLPNTIWRLVTDFIPDVLFRDTGTAGNMLYAAFALAIVIHFIEGVRKKDFVSPFIVLTCLFTFVLLCGNMHLHKRYILIVYPLLYILILKKPALRSIGYLFVFAIIAQSMMICFNSGVTGKSEIGKYWSYISETVQPDMSDYFLKAQKNYRHAYYYSGMRGWGKKPYQWKDLQHKNIYFSGAPAFLKEEIAKIRDYARQNNSSVSYTNLTKDYQGNSKYDFIQIKIE